MQQQMTTMNNQRNHQPEMENRFRDASVSDVRPGDVEIREDFVGWTLVPESEGTHIRLWMCRVYLRNNVQQEERFIIELNTLSGDSWRRRTPF